MKEYLECPQYLRKDLFPHHKDLKYAGLLNPLDTPHHLRQSEFSQYREGIILDRPASQKKGKGSWVNCGIDKDVRVDLNAPAGQRVTGLSPMYLDLKLPIDFTLVEFIYFSEV